MTYKILNFVISEQQMKLERVIASLQNELHSLRDEMVSLKNVMVLKVEQVTCQLAATNSELADMKGKVKLLWLRVMYANDFQDILNL